MADKESPRKVAGKFTSISQIHWVAGLVVAGVLSSILSLITIAVTNEWALLVLLPIVSLIIAAAVGFAVRLTSSESPHQNFLAAFVTAGLGVHVVVSVAGRGYDDFALDLINAYYQSPLSGYVIFFGVVAALFATVGRRK